MSTYEVRGNANYAAVVVEVKNLVDLPGLDNLRGLPVFGYTALVPRSTQVGDVLVVFPAEVALSEAFASAHNLFRHADKNADPTITGYLEDNRRVRAIKLRGHVSSALALRADEVAPDAPVGTSFDTIDGVTISEKYTVPVKAGTQRANAQTKVWRRVEDKFLPQHIDSENYWRNSHLIGPDTWVTVSQKLHGTSWRGGRTIVKKQLNWRERLAKRFGVAVADTEYDYVFGSRKVIKDPHNPNQNHFYASDIWTDFGRSIEDLLPDNVIVYGELIGWLPDGAPIQRNYTYNVPKGEMRLYVYRVAVVTNDGHLYDLSWRGMEQFCAERGLDVVPLLWEGVHSEFNPDDWTDITYSKDFSQALPLSEGAPCDEGVVVRAEGIVPVALKAKSPKFLLHESKMLDTGEADLESQG